MNKILIALISVALVTGCTGKQTPKDTHDHEAHEACQSHDGHDHAAEGHNHEAEGHDHERENLDHQHEGEAGHPAGEVVFTKEQAAETDFALHKVEPTAFYEVIPASGQILAAQGDRSRHRQRSRIVLFEKTVRRRFGKPRRKSFLYFVEEYRRRRLHGPHPGRLRTGKSSLREGGGARQRQNYFAVRIRTGQTQLPKR